MGRRKKRFKRILGRKSKGKNTHFQTAQNTPLSIRRCHESAPLLLQPEWSGLKAVKNGKVYLVDGSHYFNRPGPRLVDSVEILAEILNSQKFNFGLRGKAWEKL